MSEQMLDYCDNLLEALERVTRERDEEARRFGLAVEALEQMTVLVEKTERERDEARAALRDIALRECHCDGFGGPCGCGERMRDVAEEALARNHLRVMGM